MIENIVFLNSTHFSRKRLDELTKNETKIYSMNFHVHRYLEDLSIEHEIAEDILSEDDLSMIFDKVVSLYDWYKFVPENKNMEFHGINLFSIMDTTELHTFLITKLYEFRVIQKILKKSNPSKIFSTVSKTFIEKNCDEEIEIHDMETHVNKNMLWDKIEIKFNIGKIPISFKISRNLYSKLKSSFENIICSVNNLWFNPKLSHDSILLLEFNPSVYSDLIKNLSKYDKQIIFFNNRRPAIWNKTSINLLKETNSKILSVNNFLNQKEKKDIENNSKSYEQILYNILNEKLVDSFFLDGISFWNEVKNELIITVKQRLIWYMQLIYTSKKFINNSKIHSILSLNVIGETEKSILFQKNKKTHSVMLEHAFANYTKEIMKYDILSNYSLFPDKIAVWGNTQNEYLSKSHGISKDRIIKCGSPRHDNFFNLSSFQSQKNIKRIILCPRPIVELTGHNDTNLYLKYEEVLKKTISELLKLDNMQLIVKLHPGDIPHNHLIKNIIHKIDPSIVIFHTKPIDELIRKSDLVLVISPDGFDPSTVILESIILKKPVINLVLDDKFYDFSYERHKAVLSITEKNDLQKIIMNLYVDSEYKNSILSNGNKFLQDYLSNHGIAGETLAKELLKL